MTTYIGHRRLSILLKERRHWGLPGPILEAQAKLAGLVSIHAPDRNSARKTGSKKEMAQGNQSFRILIPFLYFLGLLIYLLLHIGMNTESCGGQQTWPLSKSGASHKCIKKGLRDITSSSGGVRPADILWFFLSDNQKTYFFQECFFLNQVPPSEGSR